MHLSASQMKIITFIRMPYVVVCVQAVCNVAPRGVYVCGNTTTTSGLTVSLSRDSGSGDYALEAGALVLGDQGI